MNVKRYNPKLEKDGGLGMPSMTMEASIAGSFVSYSDYDQLAAENAALKNAHPQTFGREMMKALDAYEKHQDDVPETGMMEAFFILRDSIRVETPATDAILASLRAEARKQGAVFAANRMLAAWDAGFVEDTPENAADIARAILMSTEFMDEAPDGDFDRSFADEVLEAIAAQLRSKSEVQS